MKKIFEKILIGLLLFVGWPVLLLVFIAKKFHASVDKVRNFEVSFSEWIGKGLDEIVQKQVLLNANSYTITLIIQISGVVIAGWVWVLAKFIGLFNWLFHGLHQNDFKEYVNFIPVGNTLVFIIFTVALARVAWTLFSISERLRRNLFAGFTPFLKNSISGILLNIFGFAVDYTFLFFTVDRAFNLPPMHETFENVFPTFFYFSTVTFATVGYGDIYPLRPAVRGLVTLEIISSFALIVIILANYSNLKTKSGGTTDEKSNDSVSDQ